MLESTSLISGPRTHRPLRGTLLFPTLAILILGSLALGRVLAQSRPAPAASKPLTVERIYGEPSLSGRLTKGLEWSLDGKLLSYFNSSSEVPAAPSEIWVVDVATGARRVLVPADKLATILPPGKGGQGQQTGLGRRTLPGYFWAPGGDALLFVSSRDLYWFDLETQTPRRLTAAPSTSPTPGTRDLTIKDPKISPDGRWVSFVRSHDLWVVNVATGEERQLTHDGREELLHGELDWVYPEELDISTAYWWSPDSARIAFLEMDEQRVTKYPLVNLLSYTGETEMMRYPKAGDANPIVRLGVVPVTGGDARWMDLGRDTNIYVARVAWLRDSKRLAFQRLNRLQNKLELLFLDTAEGQAQVILTEQDKYWINVHDELYFFADGRRFLWSSERDGFRHLYLYDLSGKLLKQLTNGTWEVTSLAGVDERESVVYFSATEKSPIERHLYRVSSDGGDFARISREEGTHSVNMSPDTLHYVDTYSNAMTPERQDLCRADGTRQVVINENRVAELDSYALQPVEFFTVRGADGTPLHAQMIKPPGFDASRKYPVLVHLYGGPHGQVVRNSWGTTTLLWHQLMAQKGYIIFSVDNRGMAARGHGFETPLYHRMGQVELADQLAGVAYLQSLPYVEGSRIGIWGWSYGGYMTCYAMLNAGESFKAGFAGAPVTDWRQYDTIYTERYMGLPEENEKGYRESSPVTHAAGLKGKLLIAHGTGDDNVHFANTVELAELFIQAGRYAEFQIYPGRGHPISDPPARIHLFRRVTQFFLDNL
jgi:dipeptidyl-peptidase 4